MLVETGLNCQRVLRFSGSKLRRSRLELVMDGAAVLDDDTTWFGVGDYSVIRKHTAAGGGRMIWACAKWA